MATVAETLEMAVRCESAAGPDRELDELIADALFERSHFAQLKDAQIGSGCMMWWQGGHQQSALRYTASLDAAMTLVSGFCTLISLSEIAADGLPEARVGRPDLDGAPIFTGTALGVARDTPITAQLALALCAAALRAAAAKARENV